MFEENLKALMGSVMYQWETLNETDGEHPFSHSENYSGQEHSTIVATCVMPVCSCVVLTRGIWQFNPRHN